MDTKNIKLKEKDYILTSKGSATVTQINDKSIWLDGKRYGLNAVMRDLQNVIYDTAPSEFSVDWSVLSEVKGFYYSFKRWSFYISGGSKFTEELCEVKDGIICHKGEYYLPAPRNINDDWCAKNTSEIKDGLYYTRLYKLISNYYDHLGGDTVNVFSLKEATSHKEQDSLKVRKEWNFYNNTVEQNIEHIKQLDLQKLLSKELDYIKDNVCAIFKELLPFKAANGVCISVGTFSSPLSCSKGSLYIDNSYYGHCQSGLSYGLMFEFHPQFSNEAKYYESSDITEISIKALEQASVAIKRSIDSFCKL